MSEAMFPLLVSVFALGIQVGGLVAVLLLRFVYDSLEKKSNPNPAAESEDMKGHKKFMAWFWDEVEERTGLTKEEILSPPKTQKEVLDAAIGIIKGSRLKQGGG